MPSSPDRGPTTHEQLQNEGEVRDRLLGLEWTTVAELNQAIDAYLNTLNAANRGVVEPIIDRLRPKLEEIAQTAERTYNSWRIGGTNPKNTLEELERSLQTSHDQLGVQVNRNAQKVDSIRIAIRRAVDRLRIEAIDREQRNLGQLPLWDRYQELRQLMPPGSNLRSPSQDIKDFYQKVDQEFQLAVGATTWPTGRAESIFRSAFAVEIRMREGRDPRKLSELKSEAIANGFPADQLVLAEQIWLQVLMEVPTEQSIQENFKDVYQQSGEVLLQLRNAIAAFRSAQTEAERAQLRNDVISLLERLQKMEALEDLRRRERTEAQSSQKLTVEEKRVLRLYERLLHQAIQIVSPDKSQIQASQYEEAFRYWEQSDKELYRVMRELSQLNTLVEADVRKLGSYDRSQLSSLRRRVEAIRNRLQADPQRESDPLFRNKEEFLQNLLIQIQKLEEVLNNGEKGYQSYEDWYKEMVRRKVEGDTDEPDPWEYLFRGIMVDDPTPTKTYFLRYAKARLYQLKKAGMAFSDKDSFVKRSGEAGGMIALFLGQYLDTALPRDLGHEGLNVDEVYNAQDEEGYSFANVAPELNNFARIYDFSGPHMNSQLGSTDTDKSFKELYPELAAWTLHWALGNYRDNKGKEIPGKNYRYAKFVKKFCDNFEDYLLGAENTAYKDASYQEGRWMGDQLDFHKRVQNEAIKDILGDPELNISEAEDAITLADFAYKIFIMIGGRERFLMDYLAVGVSPPPLFQMETSKKSYALATQLNTASKAATPLPIPSIVMGWDLPQPWLKKMAKKLSIIDTDAVTYDELKEAALRSNRPRFMNLLNSIEFSEHLRVLFAMPKREMEVMNRSGEVLHLHHDHGDDSHAHDDEHGHETHGASSDPHRFDRLPTQDRHPLEAEEEIFLPYTVESVYGFFNGKNAPEYAARNIRFDSNLPLVTDAFNDMHHGAFEKLTDKNQDEQTFQYAARLTQIIDEFSGATSKIKTFYDAVNQEEFTAFFESLIQLAMYRFTDQASAVQAGLTANTPTKNLEVRGTGDRLVNAPSFAHQMYETVRKSGQLTFAISVVHPYRPNVMVTNLQEYLAIICAPSATVAAAIDEVVVNNTEARRRVKHNKGLSEEDPRRLPALEEMKLPMIEFKAPPLVNLIGSSDTGTRLEQPRPNLMPATWFADARPRYFTLPNPRDMKDYWLRNNRIGGLMKFVREHLIDISSKKYGKYFIIAHESKAHGDAAKQDKH